MARPKTRNDIFWTAYKKRGAQNLFVLACLVLCQRNRMWAQKTSFLKWDELGSLCLHWISLQLTIAVTNPEILTLHCLLAIQKHFQIVGKGVPEAWPRSVTQKCFFRDKNPGRLHVTFLSFRNGQKLVKSSIDQKKIRKTTFSLLYDAITCFC